MDGNCSKGHLRQHGSVSLGHEPGFPNRESVNHCIHHRKEIIFLGLVNRQRDAQIATWEVNQLTRKPFHDLGNLIFGASYRGELALGQIGVEAEYTYAREKFQDRLG
jgi:hypothetical protein